MPTHPFIPVKGTAEVTISTQNDEGDVAINRIPVYGGVDTAWSLASLENLVNTLDTWITTGGGAGQKYVDQMPIACQVFQLQARDFTTQSALEFTKGVTHLGTDAGAKLPSGLTKACTFRTGRAGRSFRGRGFIPFLTENALNSGDRDLMDVTRLTNLVAMWSSLLTALPAGDASWSWVVVSRYSGVDTAGKPIPRTTAVTTPIVEVGYSHTALDYQRRRAPFHARHN